jgi:hypothetical protein
MVSPSNGYELGVLFPLVTFEVTGMCQICKSATDEIAVRNGGIDGVSQKNQTSVLIGRYCVIEALATGLK